MSAPIVQVQQGKLKGRLALDYDGKEYFSFQGIPYAKPPIGELRFKAPLPAESWTGIFNATIEGSECVSKHIIFQHIIGSEDCLNLNVYTPELPKGGILKPVMVLIHGGNFVAGSNKTDVYGPEFLITEDIVLVVINYRIGVLGFLSLEDTSLGVSGNAGLKDIVLALKWVQNNIEQFNGDPNNVTIFGESAGAACCNYLMLSLTTKGLFHRAILQSGVSLNPWALGSRNTIGLAKVLGQDVNNEKEALEFLMTVPAVNFLKAQELMSNGVNVSETRPFVPVIENPNPEAFITENPIDIMLSGNYNKVPIIIGYNSREGMVIELPQKLLKTKGISYHLDDFQEAIPNYYKIEKNTDLSYNIAKKIEEFYYGFETSPEEDIDLFYIMNSDTLFIRTIHVTIRALLKTLNQPIYFYRFNLETELNVYKQVGHLTTPGVCHGDDMGYLFKTLITPKMAPGSIEEISMRKIVKLWTNFAKTGNPNSKVSDSLIGIEWPQVTADQYCCLDIDKKFTVSLNPEHRRMRFWDVISNMKEVNSKL